MAYWLLKTEPGEYSFTDLEREGGTTWSGVTNALALIHMRSIARGDLALIYHTGTEKAVVGIAEVTKGAYPDPAAGNNRSVAVDLRPKQRLTHPVPLTIIKNNRALAGFDLVRLPRLSVMPVTEDVWTLLTRRLQQPTSPSLKGTP